MSQEDNSKLQQVLVSSASGKERAIVAIFLETGIRLSECAALNVCDLAISDSLGKLNIYNKRNSSCREVQLNEAARAPLQAWLKERNDRFALSEKSALFVNYLGERISTAGLDFLIRKIGIRARMNLSAQILRDTCLATLARNSKDPFLVAEIGGFKQLDSSRKYFGLVFP
jgi:site-specific recombinase XerC